MRILAPGATRAAAAAHAGGPAARGPWALAWPALAWLAVTAWTAMLVRIAGPAVTDPDGQASALYFARISHGRRLENPLLSSPKPLMTLVDGLAWAATHDWRTITLLSAAAFGLAVVAATRAVGRTAGWAGAGFAAVALAGSGPLVLQVARGNSVIWALAGWAVAADALLRPDRRWRLAGIALLLAALSRTEGWLFLPVLAVAVPLAWRRGERCAPWLLLPLVAPLLWLAHDWLLTGDALYSSRVPDRYTQLVSGRQVIPPASWLALLGHRYGAAPALAVLALLGLGWLVRRRAWAWGIGLGVLGPGVLAWFGWYAWRGTYVSWRYYDPADAAVRLAAAFGAAWLAALAFARIGPWLAARVGPLLAAARVGPRPAGSWHGRTRALLGFGIGVGLAVAACWPLAPADPLVRSTLDRDTRLRANAIAAVATLRPLVAGQAGAPVGQVGARVVAVSGPTRVQVALELGLPLGRVRDLFLAGHAGSLDPALAGAAAVFHDADADRPPAVFAPLSVTTPTRVGDHRLVPLRVDPARGLYVLQVEQGR